MAEKRAIQIRGSLKYNVSAVILTSVCLKGPVGGIVNVVDLFMQGTFIYPILLPETKPNKEGFALI